MAAVGNITINDGQATPVAHTYVPIGDTNRDGVWVFEEQLSALPPIAWPRITLSLKRPGPSKPGQNSSGRNARFTATLAVPTMETLGTSTIAGINPQPTVAYVTRVGPDGALLAPERSTMQERKNVRVLYANLLAHATVAGMIDSLSPLF